MISKILTQWAMPLGLGGMLILIGALALAWRRGRLGAGLSLAGLFWIWLWALPVVSEWVRWSLEGRYAPLAIASLPSADAIVVLGGAVRGVVAPRLFPDLNAAADRVWHGARLFHAGKAPLVVLSGGRLPWAKAEGPEADAMARFLMDLGVPEDRVLLESRSGTTYENALETRRLLATRGIKRVLLVTSALHMRRAAATFRAAGVDVVPAPTDYEVDADPERTLLDFIPAAEALADSSRALKEYLGLLAYRWRGWAE
jgi:uncharacterized SAM-binding protein YcdF (DUF218 family)